VFVATASLVETSLGRGGKESVLVGMLLLTFVPVLVASTVGLTLSVVASRRAPAALH
jgi:type III secretory pathway component EscS